MGIVGAEVRMPLGEPWRVGKRPYGRSALSTTAACLKGFYLHQASLVLSANPAAIRESDFYIVTVPTPIDEARQPDLSAMIAASRSVGAVLKTGDIVVYAGSAGGVIRRGPIL